MWISTILTHVQAQAQAQTLEYSLYAKITFSNELFSDFVHVFPKHASKAFVANRKCLISHEFNSCSAELLNVGSLYFIRTHPVWNFICFYRKLFKCPISTEPVFAFGMKQTKKTLVLLDNNLERFIILIYHIQCCMLLNYYFCKFVEWFIKERKKTIENEKLYKWDEWNEFHHQILGYVSTQINVI